MHEVDDVAEFFSQPRPPWSRVRWIHVAGLQEPGSVQRLAEKYELHPLTMEDVLSGTQRPKVDAFGGGESGMNARLFVTTRALEIQDGRLRSEQISIFLGHNTVLSFEEGPTSQWHQVRQRLIGRGPTSAHRGRQLPRVRDAGHSGGRRVPHPRPLRWRSRGA